MNKPLKPLVAGNWKMNGLMASSANLLGDIVGKLEPDRLECEVALCPPFTLLHQIGKRIRKVDQLCLGAQDCSEFGMGAYTGQVAPEMLSDLECKYVILGHSERRTEGGESSEMVNRKAANAIKNSLIPIVCVGESLQERVAGKAEEIVGTQISHSIPEGLNASELVVAYEPIWAIGTGKVPSASEIEAIHFAIRKSLFRKCAEGSDYVRLLYGGSVKPNNVEEIVSIPNVNGCLVGGASLQGDTFYDICLAYSGNKLH